LFEERATAVRPEFRIDESNRAIIDRVCRRLEGVPLAIELAAARTKLLAPAALVERLDHRLDFLVGGARDLPERQRALRRTIEWSHDLLDEPERELFRCLGLFVGSFSLSAAEAVAGGAAPADRDVLDLLASLVDKSLVRVEASAGEPRFRMLGMIAEFARDRLAESDDAVAERHARFFHDLSAEIGAGVTGGDQRRWLSVLGGEEDGEAGNIRAALTWFLDHRRLDELADMAWSLWVPAWINGRIDEGRRTAGAALNVGDEMSEISRARLLVVLGTFEMWSGDHVAAAESLRRGRELAVELGDDGVLAAATLAQSMIAGPVEGEARSEQLADESLEIYERLGDSWGQAAALNVLGWLFVSQERFDRAAQVVDRTLEASLAAGDEQFSAMAEVNLAEYRLDRGDADGSRALLTSCTDRHRSLRLLYSVAYLLEACARLAAYEGDPGRAAQLLGAASQLRESTGVSVWGSQLERRERFVAGMRSALGEDGFATAFRTGADLSYSEALDVAQHVDSTESGNEGTDG
jgi:tetratricopeptide (TPR) repeat protein